jgi:anti-sigma regulatory factor (Ser/Thr protein kinase)
MPLYKAQLKVGHDAISFRAAQHFFNSICADLKIPAREKNDMELAIEEGVMYLIEAGSASEPAAGPLDISIVIDEASITITMLSPCRPFDHESLPKYDPAAGALAVETAGGAQPASETNHYNEAIRGLGSFIMLKKLDSMQWRYIEKTGMQLSMYKMLPVSDEIKMRGGGPGAAGGEVKAPHSSRPESEIPEISDIIIKPLETEKEALAVSICAYDIYRYAYKDVIYYPAQLLENNRLKKMRSLIAVDAAGKIAGHYALMKNDISDRIGELGAAFVRPEFRKHNIFKRLCESMHEGLEEYGVNGVFSLSVTSHAATQKQSERTGRITTGIRIASAPAVFVEGVKPGERVTSVLNYRQLSERPVREVYLPRRYRGIITRAYERLGIKIIESEFAPAASMTGQSEAPLNEASLSKVQLSKAPLREGVSCKNDFVWLRSLIEIYGGEHSCGKLHAYFDLALEYKMASIVLSLDIQNPHAPRIAEYAAGLGFFYSGLLPQSLKNGHDALQLQYLNGETINPDKIILHMDSAREIMDFIRSEAPHIFKKE